MDAQPLLIVKPEDLTLVMQNLVALFLIGAAAAGALGYMAVSGFHAVIREVRAYRARRPFAERQAADFKRWEARANIANQRMYRIDRRQYEARRRAAILEWPDLGGPV